MTRFYFFTLCFFAQFATYSQSITGKIAIKDQPLSDVAVRLLNTNLITTTDNQGNFELKNVTPGFYDIEISLVGFVTIEKKVEVTEEGASLNFQMAEAATQLDAVIVTAQKTEEDLQKIPISISAISSSQIEQYRMWNSQDITAVIPNLYSSNPGDSRNVSSIRGITSTSYDPAVATYVDGVNQFGLDTYIAPLVDIERIEVLRGPQGTLYGRNAMGGVINIITKQPTNRTSGFGEINFGNYAQQRYSAGARTPLIKDKLFLGVSGMYSQTNGFYINEFDDSHFDKKHSVVGNYYLRYLANRSWSFLLNIKHNENRNKGSFPLSYNALTDLFKVNQNGVTRTVDNLFNASFSAHYTGSHFNFLSQSTYQTNWRYYEQPIDADFSPMDAITIIGNYGDKWNKVRVATQEFKITSPASTNNLKWTGGLYLFHQDNPTKQATHFGVDAAKVSAEAIPHSTSLATSIGQTTGFAFFGQMAYTLTGKLDVIGGMRYDFERKTQSAMGQFQNLPSAPFVTLSDTSAKANFSAFSPKAGLAYRINESANLYVNYSKGFRTGGFTQLSPDPSRPPLYTYKPEYSNNFEVGLKQTWFENRVRFNAATFYTLATDVQIPTLILPQAVTVTRNAGGLESKGFEAELSATPLPQLQLDYSLGYTDAKYTALILSQNGTMVDKKGNRQLFTPDLTSMLAVQYGWTIVSSEKMKFIFRLEWMYLGRQYFDLANTIEQSPYHLFNTRIGLTARNWELFFWGRNLSDIHYISYAYDFGAAHLGDPKNYGITLRKNF